MVSYVYLTGLVSLFFFGLFYIFMYEVVTGLYLMMLAMGMPAELADALYLTYTYIVIPVLIGVILWILVTTIERRDY
jgi:succinate dehydrogenase/fumarate reductase cytochrome b subunit